MTLTPPSIPQRLNLPDHSTLAYHALAGKSPTVVFLGGFMSDMTGTKAMALEAHCRGHGQAFVRFDYFGHGSSSGQFRDGTIGRWRDDALAVMDQLTRGPLVLVGSSMGGWIALLAAMARPERVVGLVGLAAAPDFTRDLMAPSFTAEERHALETKGFFEQPTAYGDAPYVITRALIEEAERHLILDHPVPVTCPVRLIHGDQDPDVPWQLSVRVIGRLMSEDVTLTLVKGGDHRLSTPADLARISAAVEELSVL
ncbi:alpha/beta fold hydrolase [Govanella unica]|uniref:Palmitoyl-protein thioesterase ABHD10, mitochondrial n=1 Tax=Govanella unica TaxID=2975056 RepID=A0A9X3Z6G1_9PROT|nr:alpha/beta hydrolase [Govania unica]MDA5192978.1 alpha/beta hydrolase [Govania unica]